MTLTITLPADVLARLQADAQAQGRPAEEIAAEQLAALYYAPQDDLETAVNEALAQVEAGQGEPFEPVAEELRARYFGSPTVQTTKRREAA